MATSLMVEQCTQHSRNTKGSSLSNTLKMSKVLSDCEIKFPGSLGTVNAKVHRDIEGKVKTVTVSKNPDGRYFASMLVDDGIECPESSSNGNAIGIDLGLTDFAVTSEGSKYQHPRATKKHEKNLARKQKKLSRKKDKTTKNRRKAKLAVAKVHSKIKRVREDFSTQTIAQDSERKPSHSGRKSGSEKHG